MKQGSNTWVSVDIEADGPIPGEYSMVSFGAVVVQEDGLGPSFFGELCPISPSWIQEALAISGYTREQTSRFLDAKTVMSNFETWLKDNVKGRPMFISDNNGFDWMFMHWYFIYFLKRDPFGHSSTNLGSLYKGMVKNMRCNFKHLRKTKHSHYPVDDARGNAEALVAMKKMGLEIDL